MTYDPSLPPSPMSASPSKSPRWTRPFVKSPSSTCCAGRRSRSSSCATPRRPTIPTRVMHGLAWQAWSGSETRTGSQRAALRTLAQSGTDSRNNSRRRTHWRPRKARARRLRLILRKRRQRARSRDRSRANISATLFGGVIGSSTLAAHLISYASNRACRRLQDHSQRGHRLGRSMHTTRVIASAALF